MTAENYTKIQEGIRNNTEITLAVRHGLGDIIQDTTFQAYILGDDSYQYSFVWGYLPDLNLYYKFMLDNIITVKNTTKKYSVRKEASYQHAIEEEQFAILENFTNIFN
jgi:hypothetical protein